MYNSKKMEYIKAISPVHAGSGQDLGLVDMPIQREGHTGFPKIEGSSLKGAIKHNIYHKVKKEENSLNTLYIVFGADNDKGNIASRIGFTDAKVLFFPVKATDRLFYYVSCPYILKRWGEEKGNTIEIPEITEGEYIGLNKNINNIILEEFIFEKKESMMIDDIIKEFELKTVLDENNTIIISDEDFEDMVCMYTEIITRNKIDPKTGVAKDGSLFSEEYLPAETIMYYQVLEGPNFKGSIIDKTPVDYYKNNIGTFFQVGANKTIGKGFVKRLGVVNE